jgi:acetyl-CoA C-acetyltransferase
VLQAGLGQNPARQAIVLGGVRTTVPAITLNNVCLASMSATSMAAGMIRAEQHQVIVVGGFESMTRAPRVDAGTGGEGAADPPIVEIMVKDGLWCAFEDRSMGAQADATNARLSISRREQDELSVTSHRRAAAATETGRLTDEITPVLGLEGSVSRDQGIRPDSTIEVLSALAPAFSSSGTVTAGNASQVSDAGAAGILASRGAAASAGLEPLAAIVDSVTVAGPDPSLHLKPAAAARLLLRRNGLAPSDVDLWEINEAFAAVVVASLGDLSLDPNVVNVNGGAIALGHPLGASGFRIILALAMEMRRRDVELGVAAICGGGGAGQAVLLSRA